MFALFWMRAAVLLYAMFFGFQPFEGFEETLPTLFGTDRGLALLFVGSAFGALFAAFGFAISAFSIPMLLDERTDAFSAMGASMVLAWTNLPVVLAWGALAMALFAASVATGLLGLVVTFPLLGHATWHAPGMPRRSASYGGEIGAGPQQSLQPGAHDMIGVRR